ncbi:hypothetical protein EV421DRAFT_1808859 [Armillaria borealis]|uniref:Protein kinase domain-containing protein n=1 Tax=Armillaria borealis TaxID=47425 RepID=A0AA39JGL2_9AGAR|nr:hypothetical protein EV421DRAFT_1808859 [Armillaria borealis]
MNPPTATYVARFPKSVDDTALPAEIDAYFTSNPPAAEGFLRQSDLDLTIIKRIIDSFYAFLHGRGILDQPVSEDVATALRRLQNRLSLHRLTSESFQMYNVVCTAVEALSIEPVGVVEFASSSQEGDISWKTLRVGTCAPLKSVAVKATSPAVLFHHAGELQEEQEYVSEPQLHTKAMASTAWLHMASSDPPSSHGIFISGISAIVVEKVLLAPNHHGLLVSPHYHLCRDDNPPTAEYRFIDSANQCTNGLPLLAIMTFLLLPNTMVHSSGHPAIRNTISAYEIEKPSRILIPPMMEASVEAKKDFKLVTMAFIIEHPDMSSLPRFLYQHCGSLGDDDPSDDSPPTPNSSPPVLPPGGYICKAIVSQLIARGSTAYVWRGLLNGCTPIIVKQFERRYFKAMNKEIIAYELISRHQLDDLAPPFYSTFLMPDHSWGAIVLGDLGDVGEAYKCWTWEDAGFSAEDFRVIWGHVKALHSIGLHHHTLAPRNVVKDEEGSLRLVDFERSSLGGSCLCGELRELERQFDSLGDWR